MTHPTDAAIAQAFRETNTGLDSALDFAGKVVRRARELDAEKGGLVAKVAEGQENFGPEINLAISENLHNYLDATPPAQAAEAVERVAKAIADADHENIYLWPGITDENRDYYRDLACAAIAAMQAGAEDAGRATPLGEGCVYSFRIAEGKPVYTIMGWHFEGFPAGFNQPQKVHEAVLRYLLREAMQAGEEK